VLGRLLIRLIDAQAVWTRPLGNGVHGFLHWFFHRVPWLRDLLNGRWLGHPLHPASTDIPIGILLLVTLFEVMAQPTAALVALAVGAVAMVLAAFSGFADYADTDGRARERATLHSVLMVVALVLYLGSLALRLPGSESPGAPAVALVLVGHALLIAGAYVGGDVVYVLGNMVSRHAFRGAGVKWIALEPAELELDGSIPQGRPIKAKLGINQLVLVRQGDRILALHDVCAHAGGPLNEGRIIDGAIACPWHDSRYDLENGRVVRGPSVYDQPAYEVRAREGGGWEARRQPG
jgi:nitrite reductase/ring-hydroxylating ferredoxin subunit/uncharacterized membrane protein